jgi:hypothetical protein
MVQKADSKKPEENPVEIPMDPIKRAEGTVGMLWIAAAAILSEETYAKIQGYCLRSCSYFTTDDQTTAAPVMMNDGRWALKDLENDPISVDNLISESLQFNIAPFFHEAMSRAVAQT